MNNGVALLPQDGGADDERLTLAAYAQRAYLEYALSVVKGRALPDVADGQKPVQRRILYVMGRMGLGWGGAQGRQERPVGIADGAENQGCLISHCLYSFACSYSRS